MKGGIIDGHLDLDGRVMIGQLDEVFLNEIKNPGVLYHPGFFLKAVLERGRRDSNPQHPARQAGALTS